MNRLNREARIALLERLYNKESRVAVTVAGMFRINNMILRLQGSI